MSARLTLAAVSLDPVTWDAGDVLGWGVVGNATVTAPSPGGNPNTGGYLAIAADPATPPGPQDVQVMNSGAGYTGDYTGHRLKFDLLGYGGPSYSYDLFFSSTATAETWYLTLGDPILADQTWQTYNISFLPSQWGGWYGGGVDFLGSLSQVDTVGLIVRDNYADSSKLYGLDNWQFLLDNQFAVPEPGVNAMAAILALSGIIWIRRSVRVSKA
jgi:hypothetical protein